MGGHSIIVGFNSPEIVVFVLLITILCCHTGVHPSCVKSVTMYNVEWFTGKEKM